MIKTSRLIIKPYNDDDKDKRIEIGYVIHPKYHNKGYATEMLKVTID